jgi:hypothetical protein
MTAARRMSVEAEARSAPVIAFRESSVTTLGRQGLLDTDQIAAAFRFRNAFEVAVDAKRASLGFEEWTDPGKPPADLVERRLKAKGDLAAARGLLGAHGYALVGRVCGEGYCVTDLFKSRRERDTHLDLLRIHLASLAKLWR